MSIPLSALFYESLSKASKASALPTIHDSTQELVRSAVANLTTLNSRIEALSLFSPNETLDDISTTDLIYLLVPFVLSEVRGRIRSTTREDRTSVLQQTQKDVRNFLLNLENYEIVREEDRALYGKTPTVVDPAKRRQLKIQQYQREKDLRARIETLRKRRDQNPISQDPHTDFDLISSLLPIRSTTKSFADDDELDSDTEDILRETTLLLLRLYYGQSQSQLASMNQELELLSNAPPSPHAYRGDRMGGVRKSDDDMWKLDAPSRSSGSDSRGPLLDSSGKPLRPFTILSSDAAQRARLQSQVFGPGYRLPTMSVDEYLQIERERGNILSDGGPASETAPTDMEKLTIESEMDGTRDADEKAETKRLKGESWSTFTDENPRGAGNTMNRG